MSGNTNLNMAKVRKDDEFYTELIDIEKELQNYTEHFKGKVIYCNCDEPKVSNFYNYFMNNFKELGLKKLIVSSYKNQDIDLFNNSHREKPTYLEYIGDIEDIKHLKGDGDFRSKECIELLEQADIIVTNPPFSLFREYITQLDEYNKKFLVIGNLNAVSYTEVFKLVKRDSLTMGFNIIKRFIRPDGTIKTFGNIHWFTNLDRGKINKEIPLEKEYNSKDYPKYYNYDAIEVSKVKEIPKDYYGLMGVPITFLHKYNPKQFEIIGLSSSKKEQHECLIQATPTDIDKSNTKYCGMVLKKGNTLKSTYVRIIIKRRTE